MNLLEQIKNYIPVNDQETSDKEILLSLLATGDDLLTRENQVAHFTASAWVVNPERTKVLMAYHKIYDSWAWLGGHADGEGDLLAVARREALEESGLTQITAVTQEPVSLEILTVDGHEKKGKYVSSHLHLNLTYLFEADPTAPLKTKPDENSDVAWIPMDAIEKYSSEPWFCQRIYSKLSRKAKCL